MFFCLQSFSWHWVLCSEDEPALPWTLRHWWRTCWRGWWVDPLYPWPPPGCSSLSQWKAGEKVVKILFALNKLKQIELITFKRVWYLLIFELLMVFKSFFCQLLSQPQSLYAKKLRIGNVQLYIFLFVYFGKVYYFSFHLIPLFLWKLTSYLRKHHSCNGHVPMLSIPRRESHV